MDFITHLPMTPKCYDCIITFVGKLTKRVQIMPSRDSDTAEDVAKSFFENVFRLHWLPDSIVSDRDHKITSPFWKQPAEIANWTPWPLQHFTDDRGEIVMENEEILSHWRRGRRFHFVTFWKGAPAHEAEWKLVRDFVVDDGTITVAFLDYIQEHDLLSHLN